MTRQEEGDDMLRVVAGILVSLVVPGILWAGDGALEINQACVQGGCYAEDTGTGFPVFIQSSGVYRLTSNLVVSDGSRAISAFAVSGQVTIDLNGFSIIGPNSCDGKPVTNCSGPSSVSGVNTSGDTTFVIRNGRVSGFGRGVSCQGACEIESMEISYNSSYGVTQGLGGNDEGLVVRHSTFKSNGGNPIGNGGEGALVMDSVFRWNAEGPAVVNGSFLDNVVSNNGSQSYFGPGGTDAINSILSRNFFVESHAGDPFTGGVSNNDNVCNGSSC